MVSEKDPGRDLLASGKSDQHKERIKMRRLREVTWCNYGTALRVGGRGVLARSALPLVDDLVDTASGK